MLRCGNRKKTAIRRIILVLIFKRRHNQYEVEMDCIGGVITLPTVPLHISLNSPSSVTLYFPIKIPAILRLLSGSVQKRSMASRLHCAFSPLQFTSTFAILVLRPLTETLVLAPIKPATCQETLYIFLSLHASPTAVTTCRD
jgi:hypothetical protein